jgi:hypothetical protein
LQVFVWPSFNPFLLSQEEIGILNEELLLMIIVTVFECVMALKIMLGKVRLERTLGNAAEGVRCLGDTCRLLKS